MYDVRIKLAPEAESRRLASGKSDVIHGRLERADATNLYVRTGGEVMAISRTDVVDVDQRAARRDIVVGGIAAGAGAALAIGGSIAFECGRNEFPLVCAFSSKDNLNASLAIISGLALAGIGVQRLVSGLAARSETDRLLKARVRIEPTVVRGETSCAPGVGATFRF
jgi:hypothetical protein